MGIAKTMSAIGEYDFYSSDYKQFISTLGQMFKVNLDVHFWDGTEHEYFKDLVDESFNFNFDQTYSLSVNHDDSDWGSPSPDNITCSYELFIPVDLENEERLTIEFVPNGIFQLSFLPFSNLWRFFIEDMKGQNDHYYKTHSEIINKYRNIRDCYISILKKINCNSVIIWTDAQYSTEEDFIFGQPQDKRICLNDVAREMEKSDGIKLYNFKDSVLQKIAFTSAGGYYLDVAFIDNFTDQF